jgi:aspartyl-tRNA(Asn)/glutamyl-tRNA(Gln) amidotransferase subunit A
LETLPHGLRVAWTPNLGFANVERAYLETCERAVRGFESVVGEIRQDTPEGAQAGLDGWRVAGPAGNYNRERASKQEENRELLTAVVRQGIDMPEKTTLAQYFDAIAAVRAWRERVATFFERYDLLLTPALVTSDVAIGARELAINGESQPNTFGLIAFTAPFNATGQPVASVPCGFTSAGLPVALQIAGGFGDDLLVMQAARGFEQAQPWAGTRPPLGN